MPASRSSGLKRDAGRIGLLFASLGGMIGSGWLFGALNAARIAGPAAIISWVIGGIAALLLALAFAELTTIFPRAGAVIIFPKLCFGPLCAQVMGWINFLAYVAVAPVEAVAVTTYADNFFPDLVTPDSGVLSAKGLALAVGLMVLFIVINLFAIRLVLAINNAITWWKLAVPCLTVIAFIATRFHAANFISQGFAPYGAAGVLSAVSSGGIIFTYLGFRQAIELAGESASPSRNLPFAILGSIFICVILYCGLQLAFIGALQPSSLAKGWAHLSFTGVSGPLAGLAGLLGLTWLAALLYADAAISPAGAGIIYNTTASRVIFALAEEELFPQRLAAVSTAGVPVLSLVLSFFVGLLLLLPLPSWRLLVGYLSSVGVLAYGIGPVTLICFRNTLPVRQYPRPFLLGFAYVVAPLAFIVANFVVFWAGAAVVNHVFGGLLIVFILYLSWQLAARRTLAHLDWAGAWWLAPYFTGLWLITILGPTNLTHGTGILSAATASLILTLFSLAILLLARACAIADPVEAKAAYAAQHQTFDSPPAVG